METRHSLITWVIIALVLIIGCGGGGGSNGGGSGGGSGGGGAIGNKLSGVSFGPFIHGNPTNGDSVSEKDIRKMISLVAPNFFSIRTYSVTHGQELIPQIAKAAGLRVAVGCWLGTDLSANEMEVTSLINLCRQGNVDIAIVGSEVLLRGDLSESQLISYINRVKETGVPVTSAETWAILCDHPSLRDACDELWANIFPFWEGVSIGQAIERLDDNYLALKAVAGDKKIVISETGWPTAGESQGSAVPSYANASEYFTSFVQWALINKVDYYFFEAFDEPWKAQNHVLEANWGIWDQNLKLKNGMDQGFLMSKDRTISVTVKSPLVDGEVSNPIGFRYSFDHPIMGGVFHSKLWVDGKLVSQNAVDARTDIVDGPFTLSQGIHDVRIIVNSGGYIGIGRLRFTVNPHTTPSIEFISIPAYGTHNNLTGRVAGVNPPDYVVVVYIYVMDRWWVKPYADSPKTEIQADSHWECDVTTGGVDEGAVKFAAFLLPVGFDPPVFGFDTTLPQSLYDNAVAYKIVDRNP